VKRLDDQAGSNWKREGLWRGSRNVDSTSLRISIASRGARVLIVALLMCSGLSLARAQTLMRFPNTHNDKIVFEAHDTLWTASIAGGAAKQLTSGLAHDLMPHFSPDGRWIAFTRISRGSEDVYVVPAEGGKPRRLTFRSSRAGGPGPTFTADDNLVVTWTPDSKNIVFLSRSLAFNWSDLSLFTVSVDGSSPVLLPLGHAGLMTFGPDGHTVAFTRSFTNFQTRKRYDGGLAPDIYTVDLVSKHMDRITSWKGTDTAPMWVGRKIYFLSDRDEKRRANLWVYDQDTHSTREVTHFIDYDIDMPSLGEGSISFQQGGKLYLLALPTEKLHRIQVDVPDDGFHTHPRDVHTQDMTRDTDKSGADYTVSPAGDVAIFSARGDLYRVELPSGEIINLTETSNADEDHPVFSPDGKMIAYTSDVTGEQQIMLRTLDGRDERELTHFKSGYLYRPIWSNDDRTIAVTNSDKELWLISVATGVSHRVMQDPHGAILDAAFSSDNRWLAFSTQRSTGLRAIHLYEIASATDNVVSSPMNSDFHPAFSMDGKYLFFVSSRREVAVSSETETNFATLKSSGVYAAALATDIPSPFVTGSDSTPRNGSHPLYLDGLMQRAVPFPIAPADVTSLEVRGSDVYYQTQPPETYGEELPGQTSKLHVFEMAAQIDRVVAEDFENYQLSANGNKVLFEQKGEWHLADNRLGHPIASKVVLDGMKAHIDPRQEWVEMFNNAWRLERDLFFDPMMDGNDWQALHESYAKLLPLLGSRDDLNYLIGEMQGELASSHMFVFGGEDLAPAEHKAMLLAVDFELDSKSSRYRLGKILPGDNTRPAYRSPLTEPGMNVRSGDYLLAINGRELSAPTNPYSAFLDVAGPLSLTLSSAADGIRHTIVVKPLRSEFSVRRLNWMERNRKEVELLSDGKVGYLYLSDFDELGTLQFFQQYYAQTDKQALIIDVRWNEGGHTSQWVLERLRRQLAGGFLSRAGGTQLFPEGVLSGPMIAITNEYTASDGDQFAYFFRKDGLGKIVGKRTWGGVRGMAFGPGLLDGGHITVPHDAVYGVDNQWIIENSGVDADLVVDDAPGENADSQLIISVQTLLEQLRSRPIVPLTAPLLPAYPKRGEVPPSRQSLPSGRVVPAYLPPPLTIRSAGGASPASTAKGLTSATR
jgi:tricorn protease